ncbi:MAG: aminotransferase class I/II-fold pyridoxal phosphate-dependent enzyme [archaeon]
MRFATRLKRLGGETAFAVGAQAAQLAKTGKKIYPFHLGDMNIKTPDNIINAAKKAMEEGKTGYCPTPGIMELRQALAADVSKARGLNYTFENVSIQTGGKPVIGKFLQTLMEDGDEVLYPNPGYPIYESMINYFGGVPKPYSFIETKTGFAMDLEKIKKMITPKTRLFIYNNYQNPMSASSDESEMKEIAKLCIDNDLYMLSDEAYFDIVYGGIGKSIASLPGMVERTVILYTFSKKFAMTGWRLGAAIGPKEIIDNITRLNLNDESCSNHFIQWAAVVALSGPQEEEKKILGTLKERRDIAVELLNKMPGVKCNKPNCTFYLFANVTNAVKNLGLNNVEEFRELLLKETGVSFCTRNHFGTPLPGETQKYIRLAYSGINKDQIIEGLGKMKAFLDKK